MLGYTNYIVLTNKREFGNGINNNTLEFISNNQDVKLCITADHGSSNETHIAKIVKMNIDVIITDHHKLREDGAPKSANAFINPQQEEDPLFREISGCAVAYLLMYWLIKSNDVTIEKDNRLLGLVAVSIIGDMMNLSDPVNRSLTLTGLSNFNFSPLGKAFMKVLNLEFIDSKDISFKVVPMINSCSRVSESYIGYVSLLEKSEDIMIENVEYLLELNNRRKLIQNKLIVNANGQLKANRKTNVIVLPGSGTGINGVIASQLSNGTKRPTIVFINGETVCSGSCRGFIPALDVKECFDYIHKTDPTIFQVVEGDVKYGGHAGAAGCSVYKEKLNDFDKMFDDYVRDLNYNVRDMIRAQKDNAIDITNIKNLGMELMKTRQLAPFGNGWENPLLLVRPETIKNVRKIVLSGGNTILVKFVVRLDDQDYNFTYFHNANLDLELKGSDILCTADIKRTISFDVKELI